MYLAMNGQLMGTNNGSFPPLYILGSDGFDTDQASEVLRQRMQALGGYPENSHRTLVVLPLTLSSEPSPWAYVPYIFSFVFTEFRITAAAPAAQMPPGFEELRREILTHCTRGTDPEEGMMGLYVVRMRLS